MNSILNPGTTCLAVLIALLSVCWIRGEVSLAKRCPPSDKLSPCECFVWSVEPGTENWEISCSANTSVIKHVFNSLSENEVYSTKFDIFKMQGVNDAKLERNFLGVFQFKTIKIVESNISAIDSEAFSSNYGFAEHFEIMESTLSEELSHGQQLFNVLDQFKNLNYLIIMGTNLKSIPNNALSSLTNCSVIRIMRNKVERIGANAFSGLSDVNDSLWIDLSMNYLTEIPENTFVFTGNSVESIQIDLNFNRLEDRSIHRTSFQSLKRPIDLYLGHNNLTYLNEAVFLPLFKSGLFKIHANDNYFVCSCRNKWILKYQQFKDRLLAMTCDDGDNIWSKSADQFKVCDIRKEDIIEAAKEFAETLSRYGIIQDYQKRHIQHILKF